MKILLLQGNDIESSRKRLQRFTDAAKKRAWNIVRMDAGVDRLSDIVSSQDLFNKNRLIIVESAEKLSATDRKWLESVVGNFDDTIVFFTKSLLSKSFLDTIPKIDKTETFETDVVIWKFLDSFKKGNAKNAVKLFHETIESQAPEAVLAMLARLVRDLYHARVEDSTMAIPDWKKRKIVSQASTFTEHELREIIDSLSEIDIISKTSDINLIDELDFLLVMSLQ